MYSLGGREPYHVHAVYRLEEPTWNHSSPLASQTFSIGGLWAARAKSKDLIELSFDVEKESTEPMATIPRIHDIEWLETEIQRRGPFLCLECFNNDNKLFESTIDTLAISEKLQISERDQVLESIDRSGNRLPYRCELYPSLISQRSERQIRLGVKYANIDQTYASVPAFPDWFTEWVDGRIVVPDTGIILNHYLSEVLLPRIRPRQIRIMIPRIVLLEIEERGNRGKKGARLSLSAFNEIRNLRFEVGASPFPKPVKADIMSSFSKISGSRGVDGFIRLEIWDQTRSGGRIPSREEEMIILTRDMMMASTASAEDLDAFYLCSAKPEETEFEVDVRKLAKIIIETAVTFETIRLEGLSDDASVIIEGMWSGKDIMGWSKKRIRVHYIRNTNEREMSLGCLADEPVS